MKLYLMQSKLEIIEKIILVTKNDNLLAGTITDGDIRRAILAGINTAIKS